MDVGQRVQKILIGGLGHVGGQNHQVTFRCGTQQLQAGKWMSVSDIVGICPTTGLTGKAMRKVACWPTVQVDAGHPGAA
jgi:hypothetical protein